MSIQTLVGSVIPVTNKSEQSAVPILKLAFLVLVFIAVTGSVWSGIQSDGTDNLYVQQANALLQGRLDIDRYATDVSVYNGRFYVPFPPAPALLLLPFVAMFGMTATKGVLVSLGLSVLNVVIFVRILHKLNIETRTVPWLTAAFFLGTSYWLAVAESNKVWFLAHVVAVTCLILAIHEALGTGRGLLVGLFLGMAVLSRQVTVYAAIFLVAVLWLNPRFGQAKARFINLGWFILPLASWLMLYLILNWLRFGNPLDVGYTYIFNPLTSPSFLADRVRKYGLFHPVYIPFNFVHMFLQGFHIEFEPPFYLNGMHMDGFGTSLTFASPFVFIAFWAKWKRPLLWAAWLSVSLMLIHILMYHGNGYWQSNGQRYTLDFLPIVILLVALGIKRVPFQVWKGAVIYSILLNVLALYLVPLMGELMRVIAKLV